MEETVSLYQNKISTLLVTGPSVPTVNRSCMKHESDLKRLEQLESKDVVETVSTNGREISSVSCGVFPPCTHTGQGIKRKKQIVSQPMSLLLFSWKGSIMRNRGTGVNGS